MWNRERPCSGMCIMRSSLSMCWRAEALVISMESHRSLSREPDSTCLQAVRMNLSTQAMCRWFICWWQALYPFSNAQQALRLGVSDILSKPVDFEQLKAAIFRAVGWKFTTNETVNLMLEYIHNHYKENMELEDLSKVTYSTESHLARLFKKHMGITILSYIHQLRIEEACRLLSGHECDIQEASFRVGYASLNNFYKYFKRYVGMTPAQFLEK